MHEPITERNKAQAVLEAPDNAGRNSSNPEERRHTQMFWLAMFGQIFAILAFAYSSCDTRVSRELDQRAWLVIKGLELTDLDHEKVILQAKISNTGRTPAREVLVAHSVEIVTETSCKASISVESKKDLGTIHPNADFPFPIRKALPWDAVDKVEKENSHVVCVRGKVNYEDVFDRAHFVDFCFFRPGRSSYFAPCKDGNTSN